MGFCASPLWKKRLWCRRCRKRKGEILAKNFVLKESPPPSHMCNQNDERDVGIHFHERQILGSPLPPVSPTPPPGMARSTAAKGGGGRERGFSAPPPLESIFLPAQCLKW